MRHKTMKTSTKYLRTSMTILVLRVWLRTIPSLMSTTVCRLTTMISSVIFQDEEEGSYHAISNNYCRHDSKTCDIQLTKFEMYAPPDCNRLTVQIWPQKSLEIWRTQGHKELILNYLRNKRETHVHCSQYSQSLIKKLFQQTSIFV